MPQIQVVARPLFLLRENNSIFGLNAIIFEETFTSLISFFYNLSIFIFLKL